MADDGLLARSRRVTAVHVSASSDASEPRRMVRLDFSPGSVSADVSAPAPLTCGPDARAGVAVPAPGECLRGFPAVHDSGVGALRVAAGRSFEAAP